MIDPIIKARSVLSSYEIVGAPALSLKKITDCEGIKLQCGDFSEDYWLDGMLLYRGSKRKIIVNTCKGNVGRNNFTLSHELGHYFLEHPPSYQQDGQSGFRCTSEDIENAVKPREVEANRFAVELLMPESLFRLDIAGAPIDFELINGMANRYVVSKQACGYRILSLIQVPCIIIRTSGIRILDIACSRAARSFVQNITEIPNTTAAFRTICDNIWYEEFVACKANKWLCRNVPGDYVYECTHVHRESGSAMTIIKW